VIEQLIKFIRDIGYDFTPDLSQLPKKWISINSEEHKAAYIFDTYLLKDKTEMLVFTIYDYKKGQAFTEKFCTRELTGAESKSVQKKIEEQKAEADKEKERKWNECREYCTVEYDSAQPGGYSPYLNRKGFHESLLTGGLGYKTRKSLFGGYEILVGMFDVENTFWGYQIIREDGQKQFDIGQRIDSVYCPLPGTTHTRIYLCEGFATALSIYFALNREHPVYASFTASNLKKVAHALRIKYPKIPIIICADNDKWKPHIGNTGVLAAKDVETTLDGISISIPDFTAVDESTHPTDYNDLHLLAGFAEVRKQIESVCVTRPEIIYPIGYSGSRYFFTTARNPQIQILSEFTSTDCFKLATKKYWELRYPGQRGGIDYETIKSTLIDRCQKVGVFEPTRVRGRGIWLDKEDVILHKGDKLFNVTKNEEIAIQDLETTYFYDPRAALDIPPFQYMPSDDVEKTEKLLSDFSFTSPDDYKLLMGWLFVAPLAGILEWRPHLMVSAAAGSGKSALMNFVFDPLFSRLRPFKKENTTEAGMRQEIGPDACIALLDEFDTNGGTHDRQRLQNIISLMRAASSAGTIARGTVSGKSLQYNARFIALASGVNSVPLVEADKSRITEIAMTRNHKRENWNEFRDELEAHFPFIANKLFWRSATLAKNVLESARVLHQAVGGKFGARAGQQYGTLLAGYHHWHKHPVITESEAKALVSNLLIDTDKSDRIKVSTDTDDCQEHLMNLQLQIDQDRRKVALAELVDSREPVDSKNQILIGFGMLIKNNKLFIPSKHPELYRHFATTPWADWTKTLGRLEKAERGQIKRGGLRARGIWLSIESQLDAF
jgi:phage/plasmid primase-like uncharacterized protein